MISDYIVFFTTALESMGFISGILKTSICASLEDFIKSLVAQKNLKDISLLYLISKSLTKKGGSQGGKTSRINAL